MMNNGINCYIISLKYAPGLWKEFTLIGERLRAHGFPVKYLISVNYANIGQEPSETIYVTSSDRVSTILKDIVLFNKLKENILDIFSKAPPKVICFYNPHPFNPLIARTVKKHFPKAMLSLYLHEPFKPDKKPYGILKAIYIRLVEFVQQLTIKYMDFVITPSEHSSHLFKEHYKKFKGENYISPLSIPDTRECIQKRKPIYFTMIGNVNRATGHDDFIKIVNYASINNLDYKFALVSSSNVKDYLKRLNSVAKEHINITNKKLISDSEINEVIRKSYAVFRLDKELTQSGVVPVSFMNSVPIIARDIIGLTQHVKHKVNGYVVPSEYATEDLIKAMDYVKNNFTKLSENARTSYEDIWAESNWDKYYEWLIKLLTIS